MIYGIGTDICSIQRVQQILTRSHARRFVERILTTEEINKFDSLSETRKVEYLAGRFAIKEAVSKALGTGMGDIVGFTRIHTSNLSNGKPVCRLASSVYERLQLNSELCTIHITLSHEKEHVVSFVVIEKHV